MPVILADPEAWEWWLDPAIDGEAARELLLPLPFERMLVRPANPIVNSARHGGRRSGLRATMTEHRCNVRRALGHSAGRA
jgi:putative SOS response-associated peptidase YedK